MTLTYARNTLTEALKENNIEFFQNHMDNALQAWVQNYITLGQVIIECIEWDNKNAKQLSDIIMAADRAESDFTYSFGTEFRREFC